jgi:lipoprotein-anchoring transpeptidase ErfK/SrfK
LTTAIVLGSWTAAADGSPGVSERADESKAPARSILAELPALRVQVLLDRAGFSPGVVDGRWGPNSRRALRAFRRARELDAREGDRRELARETLAALGAASTPVLARYRVTRDDLDGPFVEEIPESYEAQARLEALLYTSAAEALAERFHTVPAVLAALNPGVRRLEVGTELRVPSVKARRGTDLDDEPALGSRQETSTQRVERDTAGEVDGGDHGAVAKEPDGETGPRAPVRVVVSKSRLALTVEDERGDVLFYAPVTAGSRHDPLPIGNWKVRGVARDPVFHYDPDLFWDAEPFEDDAVLPPGPNSPVGRVWIDIDKEHYGIHGTSAPEQVGHVQSHGCVRLTNWDALEVAARVRPGTPVLFRD